MDEALAEQQREAYKVAGVDDDEPAMDPTKKRKAVESENVSYCACVDSRVIGLTILQSTAKKLKAEKPKERANTAVYVTGLPEDVTEDELFKVFSLSLIHI